MDSLRNGIASLLIAIGEQTGHRDNIEGIVNRIVGEIEFAAILSGMLRREMSDKPPARFVQSLLRGEGCRFNRFFLVLYLILHRIGEIGGDSGFEVRSADWLDEFGLARVLRATFHQFKETSGLAPLWGSGTDVLMMHILLSRQSFFADSDVKSRSKLMNTLFADEMAKQFLLVNWSSGVEWFNKERFEDLMQWLYMTDMISLCAQITDAGVTCEKFALAYGIVTDYFSKAESARYRTDMFRLSL